MLVDGESQTVELHSNPDSISVVERMIEEVRDKYNVSEDMYGNMLVAITEAVTNAIYHGNKSDPSKKVSVAILHNPHSITFTITDQGKGFDFYNLDDPTSPENLEKECGRGIFLMRNLADKVEYFSEGRKVMITFLAI